MDDRLLGFLVGIGERSTRANAAARMAVDLGGDALLFFVRDATLDVLVPAPGFPQTVPGGPGWRALLAGCDRPRASGEVAFPDAAQMRPATAVGHRGEIMAVLVGTCRDEALLLELGRSLPVLAALLRAEQFAAAAAGSEAVARDQAKQARTLSVALDAARRELEEALGEAARLNRELQAADRAKDEFLATLSHELRNPLAALSSALYLTRTRLAPEHPTMSSVAVAVRQSDRLARLVDDLLDLARISHGKIELQLEPLEAGEVISRAIESVRPHADARRHTLIVHPVAEAFWIHADRLRVEQILTNLLSNSVKYTDPGGRIEVAATRMEDDGTARVCFAVKDNGAGISAGALPKVFDMFMQAHRSRESAQGGLGIGLTLVRRLVEMQGGTISLASNGLGRGTEARVCFAEIAAPNVVRREIANAPAAPRPGRRHRVLIVDDNEDAGDMISEFVKLWGHEARVVTDGATALSESELYKPDVVLLDLGLPDISGFEVAARIKQRQAGTPPVLVALTGYGQPEDVRRTTEAGFDHHLVKPVDTDRLESLLRQMA